MPKYNRTVIITGANSGIGRAAALQFAKHGDRVIMACRNIEASRPVWKKIMEETQNNNVDLLQLDVSSQLSIVTFCEAFKKKYDVLDLLINNAGHFKHGETEFQQSADGMELTFATNLLGPVMLADRLLDVLAKSENPKILNACSTNIKHFFDKRRKIDFHVLCGKSIPGMAYDSYKLYGDSKLGLLMATFQMAQEYERQHIAVNAVMIPATKMSKQTVCKFKGCWRFLAILQNPFIPKAEVIGKTYYSICTSNSYNAVTGKLINRFGQIVQVGHEPVPFLKILFSSDFYPPYGEDEETSDRVWEICKSFAKRQRVL